MAGADKPMDKKSGRVSFFWQTLTINIAIFGSTLLVVLGLVLYSSLTQIKQDIASNTKNMAYALAENYMIYDSLVTKRATSSLTEYLDGILDNTDVIDVITVIDTNRICVYHYNNSLAGIEIPSIPYDADSVQLEEIAFGLDKSGAVQRQLCAFAPVKNAQNVPIGYVIVGVLSQTISKLERSYVMKFFGVVLLALLAAVAASLFMVNRVKNSLLGYEPEYFANMFNKRNEVLDNLEEGLLAIDTDGRIIMCNKTAARLLQLAKDVHVEGQMISDICTGLGMERVLESGKPEYNCQIAEGENNLLIDRIPIRENNKLAGVAGIVRDRTTMTNMAEELTGTRFIVEALRSNTHNFKNELHVILGMLQLGEVELAKEHISHLGFGQAAMNVVIANINNKTIAALILGKINEAREQGITLILDEQSSLPAHNQYLSANQLTIILGNLLENSIEATKCYEQNKEIHLFVKSDAECLRINVDDNGEGIPLEIQNSIFERGFSTKPASDNTGRGIGLYSVRQIIDSCEGVISVDSFPGEGTSISIRVFKHRRLPESVRMKGDGNA